MAKGVLIAVEGIDGVGKTTQVQLLGDALRRANEEPVLSKEPTDGSWGQKIRLSAQNGRMSLDDELHAFIEDRKEHIEHLIAPALEKGRIIVLDRYFYSTIAYQGARGASHSELSEQMKSFAPVPDVVILLDAEPSITLSRIANGRGEKPNEFEKIDALTKVRSVFSWLADTHEEIRQFDGRHPISYVHGQIVEALIEGVFKQFTAKDYDCDCPYCVHREVGSCRWYTLQESLRHHAHAASTHC